MPDFNEFIEDVEKQVESGELGTTSGQYTDKQGNVVKFEVKKSLFGKAVTKIEHVDKKNKK